MSDRPVIDLSGGKYDDFETMMSQKIGLKVMLVRNWSTPDSYFSADANVVFASHEGNEQKWLAAKEKFAKVEETTLASLRANIVERDPSIGHELSENDLRALRQTGHITLKKGNAEPEKAMLILDPATSARSPLGTLLVEHFENAWDRFGKGRNIDVTRFIENFDISAEDLRNYKGVINTRYALRNQDEFNTKDKGWYYQPWYYDFARLSDKSPGMWKDAFELPYQAVVEKFELDNIWKPGDMGIKDERFFEKLKHLSAISALRYSILDTKSFEPFAREENAGRITPADAVLAQRALRKSLEEKLKEHQKAPEDRYSSTDGLDDFRVLFPLFREIYEADKSTGPQRQYYDTIMAGLQTYFPTLTNGPVPDVTQGSQEPARELVKAGRAPASTPAPGPAAATP